jgi:hypothetical protein
VEVGKDRIAQHHLVLLVERRPGKQPSSESWAPRLAVLIAQNVHDLVQQEPTRAQVWRPKVFFTMLMTLLLRRALFMTHPWSTESASMQFPIQELYQGCNGGSQRLARRLAFLMLEDGADPEAGRRLQEDSELHTARKTCRFKVHDSHVCAPLAMLDG